MLAAVLYGREDVRLDRIDIPSVDRDKVLLRVRQAGICGSDIHYYQHGSCGVFRPSRPFTLGHELVADVVGVGRDVGTPEVGQRVVVNPAASCGHCEACKSGRCNLCPHVVMLGSASTTPPTDGAFAEYVVVGASQCHAVPDSMTDAAAAMMEPLSVALHAIGRAGGVAGKSVLISGGGTIGLLCLMAARVLGASHIVIVEPSEARRSVAARLGADLAIDPARLNRQADDPSVVGDGFDVVLEASGAAAAVRSALHAARRGGTIVQIGTIADEAIAMPVNVIMTRELGLLGTFRYADEFHHAIRLASCGRLDFRELITNTFPLAETPRALDYACSGNAVLKVHVVVPCV